MGSTVHELDPDGDVELILRNENAPFAVWGESEEPPVTLGFESCRESSGKAGKANQTKLSFESLDPGNEPKDEPRRKTSGKGRKANRTKSAFTSLDPGHEPADEPEPEGEPALEEELIPNDEPASGGHDAATADTDPPDSALGETPSIVLRPVEVRLRLSSKHLALASTYFKKMFQGPWKESHTLSGSPHRIDASEWDADAILILMNIIHGRVRSVPRSIGLEMLAKIAVLVDYYNCHEVVELFSECWIRELSCDLPKEYCRDLILWLTVSWVFSQKELFKTVTKVAVRESKGPLQTLGLPIPQHIAGK